MYYIPVMYRAGQGFRIHIFPVDKNICTLRQFSTPGKEFCFKLRIPGGKFFEAFAYGTAADIHVSNIAGQGL